jgi:hypothetical protein
MNVCWRGILSISFLLTFLLLPVEAQFEGTVTATTTGTRENNIPFTITQEISIKGKNIRSVMSSPEQPGGTITVIFRGDNQRYYTLFDQAKKYIEYSKKTLEELTKDVPKDQTPVSVTRTGKHQQFLDYTCEQVILTQGGNTIEIWATPELTSLRKAMDDLNSYQKQNVPQWSKEIEKMKLFPLKTSMNMQGTNAEINVVSIKRKSIPAAVFAIPAGYTKQSLPVVPSGGKKP